MKPNTEETIWERLNPQGEGCWLWSGAKHGRGYGVVKFQGKRWYIHRLIWTFKNGAIPDGMDLDHTCENTSCANPDHLELVTHKENVFRFWQRRHPKKTKDACIRGHIGSWHMRPNGYRYCTECVKEKKG